MMQLRCRLQLAEAFGSENRWFCSEAYGRKVDDEDLLLTYYIKSGGALDFANRFDEAMGKLNRWYCSEFYDRDIRDPEILWDYFTEYGSARAEDANSCFDSDRVLSDRVLSDRVLSDRVLAELCST